MNEGIFDLKVFIRESKDILLSPKAYFSTMKTTGGFVEPLIKVVIYGIVAGLLTFIWSILNLSSMTSNVLGATSGIFVIVKFAFITVIGLLVGAVVTLVISSICKGSSDFETNLRVVAAIMVIVPVSTLFEFIGGLNFYAGLAVSLIFNVYALWLFYNALIETLKAKPETSKLVIYILIGLLIVFTLLSLKTMSEANRVMNEFKNLNIKGIRKN
jgi:hypothetical protein